MKATQIINKEKLLDVLGSDCDPQIIEVYEKGYRVVVKWNDGSTASLYYKDGEWQFADDGGSYQAGYAYASGYKD